MKRQPILPQSPLLAASVLALLLGGAVRPASAQEKPGMRPPKDRDRPTFVPPSSEPDPEPEKKPPEEEPKSEEERLLESLAGWPSGKTREAARAVVLAYGKSRPHVHAAFDQVLARPRADSRLAAALSWIIGEAGDREGLPRVLAALRDPRFFARAGDMVDAVVAVDPVRVRENLLPLLDVPSQAVVDRIARELGPRLVPGDLPDLLLLADGRMAATRRAALGLASEVDFAAARDRLEAALADPSGDVASAVAVTLGFKSGEDGIERLSRLALGPDARQGAYAVLALVHAGEREGGPVLGNEVVTLLTGSRGLRSLDPTTRLIAAVALADQGYARPDPAVDPILEAEVVPALLDAVAGNRFFSDLMALKPLALARLRRLTGGTADLSSAPQWSAWWQEHRDGFTARRALTSLPEDPKEGFRVGISGTAAGGAGTGVFSSRADEAPPAGGAGGRFVLLSADEARGLARVLEEAGVLKMAEAYDVPGDVPALVLSVEAGRRSRAVRLASGVAVPPSLRTVLDRLALLREANRWQSYWDRAAAPTFGEFVEGERPFWSDPDRGEEPRAIRRIRLMVGALPTMATEEERIATLRALEKEPYLAVALRDREGEALASFAALGSRLSPAGEAALAVLAAAGRTEGLSLLYARLKEGSGDPDREEDLLERSFVHVPLEAVLPAAGNGVLLPVRRAALRSLGGREATEPVLEAVVAATRSGEPTVRAAAFRSMGMLRAEDAVLVLSDAAEEDPDLAARAGALEGLGLHGGPDVLPALGRAVQSPDSRMRAAAVRALAATREPEGLSYVLVLLTSDPDPAVREAADAAVKTTGGERARESLRGLALDGRQSVETRVRAVEGLGVLGADAVRGELRSLLLDGEPAVADAAAFVLGWIRDETAAPRLLEALREGRSPARTLRCLEVLSLESFRARRDRDEIARLYTGWYEVSRERGARGWLGEALAMRGFGDDSLQRWTDGGDARSAVPALLRGFGEEAWYVRRAVNLELQRLSGLSFGEIDAWTPEDRAAAVADSWKEWWDRETGVSR